MQQGPLQTCDKTIHCLRLAPRGRSAITRVLAGALLLACGLAQVVQAADANELPPADPDVVAIEDHPFGHQALAQLQRDGQVSIDGHNGQTLQIQLLATRTTALGEVLDISVDGLPGLITRRGSAFFASLPSRYGSLRLENQGSSTRLLEERFLDQRNLPGLLDFRAPPGAAQRAPSK